MDQPTRFIGMDVHKETIVVAVSATGDVGKATPYGTFPNTAAALEKLVTRLRQACSGPLKFCYEAGPCGYGVHRALTRLGEECMVVAPSMIPRKSGERQKNDKRDAASLAVLHRGGLLTAVWVPDAAHEAMRDLIRARLAAVRAVRTARQQLSAFLLRHERIYRSGGKAWTKAHRGWLVDQSFAQPAQQIVLEESIEAVRLGEQRRDRVDGYLRAQIPSWSLFPLVQNLGALRGLDTIAGAGLAAAIGDPSRFASAPDFMAYIGLVPSEHSSGPKRRIGAITKSGDMHARTLLIEAAHSYRFPARITRRKLAAVDAVPEAVREIAWKAQTRLCQRYRHMMAKGKPTPVIVTAIARELAGFVWSIGCITSDPPAKTSAITTTTDEVPPTRSTGQSRSLRRQPLKSTHRAARPEQTHAPIESRYVTHAQANNPKASTRASRTRKTVAASTAGSTG
ncbi:MAG: putative transposase y4qE [Rhodopila sp.]|nr:putative transposase y4qE [Rhodopila sp.]